MGGGEIDCGKQKQQPWAELVKVIPMLRSVAIAFSRNAILVLIYVAIQICYWPYVAAKAIAERLADDKHRRR